MDLSSIAGATGATANLQKSETALSKFANDFDDFLQLLVTQLKNQDPTAPLDANQFTQQIVQFTGVEQQINTNKKLDEIREMNNNVEKSNIVSFAGKNVELEGANIYLDDKNPTNFSYDLPSEFKGTEVNVIIRDQNKNLVFSGKGTSNVGANYVNWDGKDVSGNRAKPGYYTVDVSSLEVTSNKITNHKTFVSGVVSGVNIANDNTFLVVNGANVALDKVKFIGEKL